MKPNCNICNNSAKCELLTENNALKLALEKAKQNLKNEDVCNYCVHIDDELLENCHGCRDFKGAPNWAFKDSLLYANNEAEASNELKPNAEVELVNYLEKIEQWEAQGGYKIRRAGQKDCLRFLKRYMKDG